MRKQRNDKSRTEAVLSAFITTALVLTLAITVATAINKGNSDDNNNIVDLNETNGYDAQLNNEEMTTQGQGETQANDRLAQTIMPTQKATEAPAKPDDAPRSVTTPETETSAPTQGSRENVAVDAVNNVRSSLSFSENSTLFWPVTGDIILKYNMDNTIWFPTLGVYKCNPAIYIASETGTKVSAACNGVVESITRNEETGTSIKVSVGNGYTLTYGQIDNPQVVEGDLVKAGEAIGSIAQPTIYYTTEGSGLYFKVECDDKPCDPMLFLE